MKTYIINSLWILFEWYLRIATAISLIIAIIISIIGPIVLIFWVLSKIYV